MEDYERARIQQLSAEDPELAGLWREHLDYEQRLGQLDALLHLNLEEQTERKELQKRKLAGKDRIVAILARQTL